MKTIELHKAEIKDLEDQIKYSKDKLKTSNIEKWVKKEYEQVIKNNLERIRKLEECVRGCMYFDLIKK